MNKEHNIILTSINPYLHINARTNFYYSEDETTGESQYCVGLSDQEAGAKFIMSSNKVDGVIVVGSKFCCPEEYHLKQLDINTTADLYKADIIEATSFTQFAYRLAQFVNGVDIDTLSFVESYTEEEKEKLDAYFKQICEDVQEKFHESDKTKLLHYIRLYESKASSELIPYIEDKSDAELREVLSFAYALLDSHYKMKPFIANNDIKMWFAPINKGFSDTSSISNILYIFDYLLQNNTTDTFNIYLDTQGLNQTDSLALFEVVTMLSKQSKRIVLKDYITSNPYYGYWIRKIKHSLRPVALTDLSAGINDFINYGKADLLINYWIKGSSTPSKYVEDFVYAMRKIDIGISLCNYAELEAGIKQIKKLIHKEYIPTEEDFESGLFSILTYGILEDYGPLLEGDDDDIDIFELIKWANRKKYYQQAITFIESQIPDDIVNKGIWYYAENEDESEMVTKYLAKEYNNTEPKLKYNFNHINHYLVKTEGRNNIQKSSDRNRALAEYKSSLLEDYEDQPYIAHSVIKDKKIIEDALTIYYETSNKRNDINHAERSKGAEEVLSEKNSESFILDQIEGIIGKFIETYQKAVDAAEGKQFTSIQVTKNQVSDVAFKSRNNSGRKKNGRPPTRYAISCPEGFTAHCDNIKNWLFKYPDKHPELMDEDPDIVVSSLMKTRDEYVNNKKVVTYKGYRLLPTEYDKPLVS